MTDGKWSRFDVTFTADFLQNCGASSSHLEGINRLKSFFGGIGAGLAALFLCYLALAASQASISRGLALFYFIASAVTFLAYARDKASAAVGLWRTSELTLHCLSLVGGWPGALIAIRALKHKSGKASFLFWVAAAASLHAVVWALMLGVRI